MLGEWSPPLPVFFTPLTLLTLMFHLSVMYSSLSRPINYPPYLLRFRAKTSSFAKPPLNPPLHRLTEVPTPSQTPTNNRFQSLEKSGKQGQYYITTYISLMIIDYITIDLNRPLMNFLFPIAKVLGLALISRNIESTILTINTSILTTE